MPGRGGGRPGDDAGLVSNACSDSSRALLCGVRGGASSGTFLEDACYGGIGASYVAF